MFSLNIILIYIMILVISLQSLVNNSQMHFMANNKIDCAQLNAIVQQV